MMERRIQEMQGLYGPFTLTERVVQKIWLRQDFATDDLQTVSGRSLCIQHPGQWNRLDGPDFKEARLVIDGRECTGDVEIHFSARDWFAHRHETDSGFDRVVLHVVLQGRDDGAEPARTAAGHQPETLVLMPLLERDLEAYAMDDALLELEQQDELEWVADFLELPLERRLDVLEAAAVRRWMQKLSFARARLAGAGWEAACHQFALEVLGYARNRAPMSRLALRYPLGDLGAGDVTAEALYLEEKEAWRLSGLRPANHPRRRLHQYMEIVRRQPDWPVRLKAVLQRYPATDHNSGTPGFRRAVGLSALRRDLATTVFCDQIGETRLNALICDALLPLATAAGWLEGASLWKHWMPGDVPDVLRRFLAQAQITTRTRPHTNGWNQGALDLFLARGC